jgi:hypothetical protein
LAGFSLVANQKGAVAAAVEDVLRNSRRVAREILELQEFDGDSRWQLLTGRAPFEVG